MLTLACLLGKVHRILQECIKNCGFNTVDLKVSDLVQFGLSGILQEIFLSYLEHFWKSGPIHVHPAGKTLVLATLLTTCAQTLQKFSTCWTILLKIIPLKSSGLFTVVKLSMHISLSRVGPRAGWKLPSRSFFHWKVLRCQNQNILQEQVDILLVCRRESSMSRFHNQMAAAVSREARCCKPRTQMSNWSLFYHMSYCL